MNKPTRWFRSWKTLATAAIVALGVSVVVVVLMADSSPSAPPWSPPNATTSAAIQAVIDAKWAAVDQVLPAKDALAATAPQADVAKAQADYLAGMQAVGTQAYVDSVSSINMGASFEGDENLGIVVTQLTTEVLALTYEGTLPNGDSVIWAKLWDGEVDLHQSSGDTTRVDDTPTYQYVMRNVSGQWKIVSEDLVFQSEDTSSSQYGPDTPHSVSSSPLVAIPAGASTPMPSSSPTPTSSGTATAN